MILEKKQSGRQSASDSARWNKITIRKTAAVHLRTERTARGTTEGGTTEGGRAGLKSAYQGRLVGDRHFSTCPLVKCNRPALELNTK